MSTASRRSCCGWPATAGWLPSGTRAITGSGRAGRKLGSVGIAVRHGVAFHGLALNVNLSLLPFSWINPCGLCGVQMTSLAVETKADVSIEQAGRLLPDHLQEIFSRPVTEIDRGSLLCREAA